MEGLWYCASCSPPSLTITNPLFTLIHYTTLVRNHPAHSSLCPFLPIFHHAPCSHSPLSSHKNRVQTQSPPIAFLWQSCPHLHLQTVCHALLMHMFSLLISFLVHVLSPSFHAVLPIFLHHRLSPPLPFYHPHYHNYISSLTTNTPVFLIYCTSVKKEFSRSSALAKVCSLRTLVVFIIYTPTDPTITPVPASLPVPIMTHVLTIPQLYPVSPVPPVIVRVPSIPTTVPYITPVSLTTTVPTNTHILS